MAKAKLSTTEIRQQNLLRAVQDLFIDEEPDEGYEEDYHQYLLSDEEDGQPYEEIKRWAAVTQATGKRFIYPCYPSMQAAIHRSLEFVNNELYAEWPVCVIDLDRYKVYYPKLEKLVFAES